MRRTGIAIITILALGLTGCSGGDEPAPSDQAATGVAPAPETNQGESDQDAGPTDGATFDFTNLTEGPSTSMTVEIGESLANGLGSTVDELLIERVVITPLEMETGTCAATWDLTWASPEARNTALNAESPVFTAFGYQDSGTGKLSDFDPSVDPEKNLYVADDLSSAVRVRPCGASPVDMDKASGFEFRTMDDGVAEVDFVIMADGTVSIADSEVDDMVQDSNGMWIQD